MDDGRMDMVYLNIKSAGEWYIFSEGLQTSTASKHQSCWLTMSKDHTKISAAPKYRPHQIIDHNKLSTTPKNWPH